ncbi:MAG TPA: glutathione S-transferase, partial [Myxococcota bacterium]|nr:glutathione S-transferase [Myxococcota bacterium]
SSWSVRAWLALTEAGIAFETETIPMFLDAWDERMRARLPAGKVPTLIDGDLAIHESLAICEYAAELEPEARLWPESRAARARARAISCEMASGFASLRRDLPMNARARSAPRALSDETRAQVQRSFALWKDCLRVARGGPFLFGAFTIADAMYAPVVSRYRTYGVPLEGAVRDYADALWSRPSVVRWLELAATAPAIPKYDALLDA